MRSEGLRVCIVKLKRHRLSYRGPHQRYEPPLRERSHKDRFEGDIIHALSSDIKYDLFENDAAETLEEAFPSSPTFFKLIQYPAIKKEGSYMIMINTSLHTTKMENLESNTKILINKSFLLQLFISFLRERSRSAPHLSRIEKAPVERSEILIAV